MTDTTQTTDHAAAIRHKADVIALTIEDVAERYRLSEYLVRLVRREMDAISTRATALPAGAIREALREIAKARNGRPRLVSITQIAGLPELEVAS